MPIDLASGQYRADNVSLAGSAFTHSSLEGAQFHDVNLRGARVHRRRADRGAPFQPVPRRRDDR